MQLIDGFELLIHGVQAIRRRVELLSCPLSGGSGVRAQFYPHQLQNVQRILNANRIHHLIADEVGMGKTIQALMIANAIRLQKGKLRVRIVVPRSELQAQWITEIACRAHCAAELDESPVGDDWFDVVDDSGMTKPSEILDPSLFDLLVLDEPQSLQVDTLRFVASNSSSFPRLLLLTASPNLRDFRRLLELLQILEPERIERARRAVDVSEAHNEVDWSRSRIGDLEDEALQLIYAKYLEQSARVTDGQIDTSEMPKGASPAYKSFAEYRRVRVVSETCWMYRNILRSYRIDYPNHLPRREPKHLVIEPTAEEAERMVLAASYVGQFLEMHSVPKYRSAGAALLQRTALGGLSLQTRIRQIRSGADADEPRLLRISELTRREVADCRLDCLVDWLTKFWSTDPNRKVVVAAEDNVTVEDLKDELGWRIPFVGPRGGRKALRVVTALDERHNANAEDDSNESQTLVNLANSQLRDFEDSSAQLLIAHNVFRQSYNLQSADALVFFSLPWKPEDVDQWIGRVDRLGRDFVDPERPASRAKPVRIVTIHRHGDPTMNVQEVLDEFRVFECAVDPERNLLETITEQINLRALPLPRRKHHNAAAEDSEVREEHTGSETSLSNIQGKLTSVPLGSHWTVQQAIELHNAVANADGCGPILRHTRPLGYVSSKSEEALAKWIALLRQHRLVNITKFGAQQQAEGRRSRTYYTLGQSPGTKPMLSLTQVTNHKFIPFFIARSNIQRPPRLTVNTAIGDSPYKLEPLHFLSFGSPLHTDIQQTFERSGKTTELFALTLYALGTRHYPAGTQLTKGIYLTGVGFLDAAHAYARVEIRATVLSGLDSNAGTRRSIIRDLAVANACAGIEADIRFVRANCLTRLDVCAWKRVDERWTVTSQDDAADLFAANWSKQDRPNVSRFSAFPITREFAAKFRSKVEEKVASQTKVKWLEIYERFKERLAEREEIIRIDAELALSVLRSAIDELRQLIAELLDTSTVTNEQKAQRNYVPQLNQLEEEHLLIERTRDLRLRMLDETLAHVCAPRMETVEVQCLAAIQLEDDPVPLIVSNQPSDVPAESEFVSPENSSPAVSNEELPKKPR